MKTRTLSNLIRSLVQQRRSLCQVSSEQKSPEKEIQILFHSSGLTCNQWRKLKNLFNPGRIEFRPTEKNAKLPHSAAGPTCVLHLPEAEASSKLGLLPPSDSSDHDLLLLYGQYGSTLVDHVDVEKAKAPDFDDSETAVFSFYLPTSYLSFVCSGEEAEPSPAAVE